MPATVTGGGLEDFSYTDLYSGGKSVILSATTMSRIWDLEKRLRTYRPNLVFSKQSITAVRSQVRGYDSIDILFSVHRKGVEGQNKGLITLRLTRGGYLWL